MVTGELPIYNEDMLKFFDDLEEKEIVYPEYLSPSLRYPFSSFKVGGSSCAMICFPSFCVVILYNVSQLMKY